MDDGYRKMLKVLNSKTDKVEPMEMDDVVLYPPTPGPASPYHGIASTVAALVTEKQAAYGDSFGRSGEVLRILYPNGIPANAMPDALTIVRVIDKLFRVATRKDAFGESPWRDVVGYGLLAIKRDENKEVR
jgi:hypothetical protein